MTLDLGRRASRFKKNDSLPREAIVVCSVRDQQLVQVGMTHIQITEYCRNSGKVGAASSSIMGAEMIWAKFFCCFEDDFQGLKKYCGVIRTIDQPTDWPH